MRLPDEIKDCLQQSGIPWRVVAGGRHYKIFVGRRLAGIMPLSMSSNYVGCRRHKNTLAQVRRAVREQKKVG